ncbi:hypothetical protein Tco_1167184 [Tanacetum coccineum]
MVYTGGDGKRIFVSHAWRRLVGIQAPLVYEFIMEFLSTYRMSDTKMDLDVAGTLCFQLGGVRRSMSRRQFILALGLHTEQEMAQAGFAAYLSERERDDSIHHLWKRTGVGKGDWHAEGRKSRARMSGGHFIGHLVEHFGLVSDEGLRGLTVISRELPMIDLHKLAKLNICGRFGDTWAWVAPRPEREVVVAADALEATKDAPAKDEGTQADTAPAQDSEGCVRAWMSILSLRPCMHVSAALLDDDLRNYGVTCEEEAKKRNSGAKTKTFEENTHLTPYVVSNKKIRRISASSSQEYA